MKRYQLPWLSIAFLSIAVGIYPATYYLMDMHSNGLFQTKPKTLLDNRLWNALFYVHITFGGIALLTGWPQFSTKLRNRYLRLHRTVGKVYITSVFLSSLAGLYVAFYASGGIVCVMGFGILAVLWFYTNTMAYTTILKRNIIQHRYWMIRNYALTFGAVTLRLWLPILANFVFHEFIPAYRIVSWLAWVPNLFIAEIIIRNLKVAVKQ
ncbi:DUF2306 domain-containing protein [Pedobacter sp. HMF7647]|uniref:DUF2306 domain-containing protein n=1 Tax=Hufsiella arboris TaxID=2695275 RepID=A0A7K1Y9J9_9SPHI|nr:DUF2306 domain-containing protein [Hufsiella arboris]MXV51273.1 DUF2306 domain-containing protein [Hufsiella arboris]